MWVKLGQYLSSRPDIVPEQYTKILSRLQDAMPCSPVSAVRQVIEAELGAALSDTFSKFDDSPIASASIAQVHRASLREGGQQVVVKVQHPGVAELMTADLADVRLLMRMIAWLEPDFDFTQILDEWCEASRLVRIEWWRVGQDEPASRAVQWVDIAYSCMLCISYSRLVYYHHVLHRNSTSVWRRRHPPPSNRF